MPHLADLVIRAGAIYAMTDRQAIHRSIALRDQWIVATSQDPQGLDGLISAETRVIDDPTLTLLPAFYDSHNHLLELARNALLAPVDQARSIAEFVAIIRQRAASVPAGQ
jgi:predicted amidohydrolase YtcJ